MTKTAPKKKSGVIVTDVFNESNVLQASVRNFLQRVIDHNPRGFFSLFEGTHRASECETIVEQAIRGMLKTGRTFNGLKLARDGGGGLVDNSGALSTLKAEGYVLTSPQGDKITITDKMIVKLTQYCQFGKGTTSLLMSSSEATPMLPG